MKIKCPQRLSGQIANFSPSLMGIVCHLWHFTQKIFLFILLWVNPFKPITNAFFHFCIAGKRSFFNSYTVPH